MNWKRSLFPTLTGLGIVLGASRSNAAPFSDQLVQPPSIGQPERGSVAGSLSRLAFGPSTLARGTYALPLPIDTPAERGAILASVIPSYSAESGIGEWGVGFQSDLAIRRHRPVGEIDFTDDDDFTSPWGRLVRGDDGAYYPAGMRTMARVVFASDGWEATTADGTVYRFDEADADVTQDGTYAWNLSRVDTLFGDSTTLSWQQNASGRAFLHDVTWGGRGDGTQYRMVLDYEMLATPFVTFVSGERADLDRRVRTVTTSVKEAGSYVERWRHQLAYVSSPTGPAFYLASVTKRFASGATEPPVTYTYDFSTDQLANAAFEEAPQLDEYLATYGSGAIQPDRASMTDLERNGLTDMEVHLDNTLVRQTDDGYVFEPLPPPTGAENPLCRPAPSATNKPRFLARMHGDADEPNVVVTKLSSTGTSTRLLVCDRAGMATFDQTFSGAWAVGANTRLADVDRDQRPDLARVSYGRVEVLANSSTAPDAIAFSPGVTTNLTPRVTPISSWILDFNGDARPDLMVRHAGGVVVWRGIGSGRFEPTGTSFNFVTASGSQLSNLGTYELSHGDFNNDGLSDLILTKGQTVLLFTNRGSSFVETPVAAFASIPWTVSYPVVVDLSGSGNEQIVMASGTAAKVLQLSRPSTGLLVSADDGKGTVVELGYGRVRPAPGMNQLYSILTSTTMTSSGYDTVRQDYDYGAPVWHSVGKYLVGFEDAHQASPLKDETVSFFNDDDIAGAVVSTLEEDARLPDVFRFTEKQTELASFHGVPWLRLVSEETGYRNGDGSARSSTRVDYLAYDANGVCPVDVATTTPEGVNRQRTTLTQVANLDPELVCLTGALQVTGTHPDPTLDYAYEMSLVRDDDGRITHVEQAGPDGPIVLQDVVYGADDQIASVTTPGGGTSTYAYDAAGQIVSVTTPDGVVESIEARAPITDAVLHGRTTRGAASFDQFHAYDDHERLQRSWDSVSGSSAVQPLLEIDYVYPTANAPGRILERRLVDAASGALAEVADLVAADGTVVATAARQPQGWSLGLVSQTLRNEGETRSFVHDPLGTLDGLTHASLLAGGTLVGVDTKTGNGSDLSTWRAVQAGVESETGTSRVLSGDQMVVTATENGANPSSTGVGPDGKARWYQDQNGVQTIYRYDAMGRLRRVLTGGGEHTVDFDAYGRPSRVGRVGLRSIEYDYDNARNRMSALRERDGAGVLDRTETYAYDAIGRTSAVTSTKAATGETRTVTTRWDGAQATGAPVPDQLGFASSVSNGGVEKSTTYTPDQKIASTRIDLDGWRTVQQDFDYLASGAPRTINTTIVDANGDTVLASEKRFVHDASGRLSAGLVDGTEIYSISYDVEGRASTIHFADGDLVFSFDPVTRTRTGYAMTGAVAGAVSWAEDERGLTSRESFTVAGETVHRDYAYDARRFLVGASDENGEASYAYDAAGLVTSANDQLGDRYVTRTAGSIVTDDATFVLDGSGRVVSRGDLSVAYGPSGQLERATRDGTVFRFAYDETGKRVLKYEDDEPVAAYVAGGYLAADGFVEPVTIEGVMVGVLENGVFRRVLFDRRGTSLVDDDGALDLASPYGVRLSHGTIAAAIDYVEKGFDADLGLVRMGVRDYDPTLGHFWTPDPLFLSDIDKCVASPVECNLYGYAKNDPVSFVDPSGNESELVRKDGESQEQRDERLAASNASGETWRTVKVWGNNNKRTVQSRSVEDKSGGFNVRVPNGNGNPQTAQLTLKSDHVFVSRSTATMPYGKDLPLVVYSYVETEMHVLIKDGRPSHPWIAKMSVTHVATTEGGGFYTLNQPSPRMAEVLKDAKSLASVVDVNKLGTAEATPTVTNDTVGYKVSFGNHGATRTQSSGSVAVSAGVGEGVSAGVEYTFPTSSTTANAQGAVRTHQVNVNLFPKSGNAWTK